MKHLPWSDRLQSVVDYCAVYGEVPRDRSLDSPAKQPAIWLSNQRSAYRNGQLSQEQIDALNQTGIDWLSTPRRGFKFRLEMLKNRVSQGDISTMFDLTKPEDQSLKSWLLTQAKRSRTGQLTRDHSDALELVLPGWDAPMPIQPQTHLSMDANPSTEQNPPRGTLRRNQIRAQMRLIQAIDADRGATEYEGLTWFVDHHLGTLGRPPKAAEIEEIEARLSSPVDLELLYPLTTYSGKSAKKGIKQQDLEWIESALDLASYRARLGRFPRQVGNRAEYRERFNQERAKPTPREHVLQNELSDESIALYHWLNIQRIRDVDATLREDRSLFLHEILPGWNERSRRRPFSETAVRLARFTQDWGRWPSRSSADRDELHLAETLKNWRVLARKSTLSDERATIMLTLFGETWTRAGIRPYAPGRDAVRAVESNPVA